ncbi:hypothetical protein JCM24511_05796, partial [Saitozyma sp. JCM 24511]
MSPKELRWGILATGKISTNFSKDILTDPSTRGVSDVSHRIAAVGSRSVESAQAFVDKLHKLDAPFDWGAKQGKLDGCKVYGNYDGVYNDPNVDAIYIGTPHVAHFDNAKNALSAGKHVLCEKPFVMKLEELDELIALAKKHNVFLMEAVWTRFQPIAYAVQEVLFSGKLGKVKRVEADFSIDFKPDALPDSHRMIDPTLGGGSLLDLGPYPSVWAMLTLFQHPDNHRTPPNILFTHQTPYARSGVDLNSRWLLEFPGLGGVQALLTTDMGVTGGGERGAVIVCEEGDIAIEWGLSNPSRFWITPHTGKRMGLIKSKTEHHHPVQGNSGMAYEADEVARCVRDGKNESERMRWEESRIVQGWFDRVRGDAA